MKVFLMTERGIMDRITQLFEVLNDFKTNTNYGVSHIEMKPEVFGEFMRELESLRSSRFEFELKFADFLLDNFFVKESEYESENDMIIVANRKYI